MKTPDPAFTARLDRVQASASNDLKLLIDGFRVLRARPEVSREIDLAQIADMIQKAGWTASRMAYALAAAVDHIDRESA
jgi:hypothetical protein